LLPRLKVMTSQRIDTERLLLRSPIAADAATISALLGDWDVARWLVRVPYPYRLNHAEAWIERSAEERAAAMGWPFMMVIRDSGTVIGSMDLSLEPDRTAGALGYWVGGGYWGAGYATEAARALIEFAFTILKLEQVIANTLPDNDRSMRVLKKAGLGHVGRRPEDTAERGRVDTEFFVLDRASWLARQ